MICKNCGTETKGRFCSYCGTSFFGDEPVANDLPERTEPQLEPIEPFANDAKPAQAEPKQEDKPDEPDHKTESKPGPQISDKERRRQELGFGKVFWPSLMLMLPIAYFFVDVFARLSDLLFQIDTATGKTMLSVFLQRLTSADYAMNSMQEIKLATFGGDVQLYQSISAAGLSGAGDLAVPLLIVLGCSLLCAVCGVLTLFSGGKLLTNRLFLDLTSFFGYAAAFSPLLGLTVYRFIAFFWYGISLSGLAYADAAMRPLSLSVESILLIGIMMCVLIPNLNALRTMGARARNDRVHVALPYSLLAGRSFLATRLLALLFILATVALVIMRYFLAGWDFSDLLHVSGMWQAFYADWQQLVEGLWHVFVAKSNAVDFNALGNVMLRLVLRLQLPYLVLAVLLLLFPTVRIIVARKQSLARKKWACRSLRKVGARTRSAVLFPFWCYVWVQILLALILLVGSALLARLDLANVSETLSLLYLLAGNVKTVCGADTLFSIWALGGVLLSHLAGNMACNMILISHKAQFKK